jgi:hypothetical protein
MKLNKKVFIINGSGGVGKDTFCEYVGHYAKVKVISSIDLVKDYASKMGWNGSKTPRDRKFLSDLKDLLTKYNDYPFRDICQKVLWFKEDDNEFLFIHIREPEEIDRAKIEFNAHTILMVNDNVKGIYSNHADARVLEYNYDIVIDNSGTLEDLEIIAKDFVEKWRNKR